jgi:hypothetical protein
MQLAKLAGNFVIGTCGSPEKAEMLRQLGCDRVINYREENVGDVLKNEFRDRLDLVYESVGREMFDLCLRHLAVGGRLVIIGMISEYLTEFENVTQPRIYSYLLRKSASVRGMFLPHFNRRIPEYLPRLIEQYESGQIKVAIDDTPFDGIESVVDAVEHLHSGRSRGKVVVRF